MAEWSNAAVLKTVVLQGTGGSNPSTSATYLKQKIMITFIIIILSLTIVGLGFAYKEITSLRKEVEEIHNRISVTDQQTHLRISKELEEVNELIRSIEVDIKSQLQSRIDKLTSQVVKSIDNLRSEIPPTNDTLLKEVQQMRDDFFALRQNF